MTRARVVGILGIVFLILILGTGGGAWWYLYGPNKVDAAELVPSDTMIFATIPNAANIVTGYETSQLKQLVDSPNSQPLRDALVNAIGQKNVDLFFSFAPNLSGQSFFAVTHFDPEKFGQAGLIAGMKPKAGMGSFNAFIAKLKETWPDTLKQGTTGTGNAEGIDYQWIKGPGAGDKICVAQVGGWIITTWGVVTLKDWIQRYNKKSTTPSLAQNADYQKSVAKVGKDSMTLLYINYHAALDIYQKQMDKINPGSANYLAQKFASIGGMAIGTRFVNGEIVDRFSCIMPQEAQLESGMAATACPFDTMKFTGPTTRLYWASNINWQQYSKNMKDQASQAGMPNPISNALAQTMQTWTQGTGVDIQHNIVDALGDEFALVAEWNDDQTYPEVGFLVKVAKPDDFKPVISALVENVSRAFASTAVVTELTANSQTFSALKFIQAQPISPTVTQTGPYFGVFSTEGLAARSYTRTDAHLTNNTDFARQIGDRRNGASQIIFIDTPRLADRAYKTATPYLSLAAMFNKDLAAALQGKNLPPDLAWLAPMGTWSFVLTPDAESVQGYSVSGIGNQGILMAFTAVGGVTLLQSMGMIPKTTGISPPPAPPAQAPGPAQAPAQAPAPTSSPAPTPAPTTTTTAPAPPSVPATTPDTNAPTPDAPQPH